MTFGEAMIVMEKGEHCKPIGNCSRYYVDYNKAHQKTLFYSVGSGWKSCPTPVRDLVAFEWEACGDKKTDTLLHKLNEENKELKAAIAHMKKDMATIAYKSREWNNE